MELLNKYVNRSVSRRSVCDVRQIGCDRQIYRQTDRVLQINLLRD